jgi:predicted nicotinamide N-methyase
MIFFSFILYLQIVLKFCDAFSTSSKPPIIYLPQIDVSDVQRKKLDGKIPIRSRNVPIDTDEISKITIWEIEDPSKLMGLWWAADLDPSSMVKRDKIKDPFGIINWPGSTLCGKELVKYRHQIQNKTVLSLGAGTGVEAQCAALLGAKQVIALDISNLTLKLLMFGAREAGVDHVITPLQFDLFSDEPLPECDILLAADVLYNPELAMQVGKRVLDVLSREKPVKCIVTDSQRFHGTDFVPIVNKALQGKYEIEWNEYELKGFRGSGIMMTDDQTYDVRTRMISFGFDL